MRMKIEVSEKVPADFGDQQGCMIYYTTMLLHNRRETGIVQR